MGAPYGNKNAVGPHVSRKNHPGFITKEGRIVLNLTPKQFMKMAVRQTPALNRMKKNIEWGAKNILGKEVKKKRSSTRWGKRQMGKYARELRSFLTKRGIISKRGISLNSKAARRIKELDMQTVEFNKLINGEPEPRWIEMPQVAPPTLPNNTEPAERIEIKPTKGMLAAGKVKEKVVPIHIAKAISDYVELQRKRRIPERAIRRSVMRKRNIKMLK